jgi:hypothetical protein
MMDGKVHYYPENLDNRYWLLYYSKMAIIAANNHYAGFGPMTTKLFAEMIN